MRIRIRKRIRIALIDSTLRKKKIPEPVLVLAQTLVVNGKC